MKGPYDVVIAGGGVSGATSAYRLIENNPYLRILVLDNSNKYASGWRNDCKFNVHHKIGIVENPGIPEERLYELFDYSVGMFKRFIPDISEPVIDNKAINDLEMKVDKAGAELMWAKQYHLGTERGVKFTKRLYDYLEKKGVDMQMNSNIYHIEASPAGKKSTYFENKNTRKHHCVEANFVIMGLGRLQGEHTSAIIARKLGLETRHTPSQVGIRIEVLAKDYPLTSVMYDPKIYFDSNVRTFCTNPNGFVIASEKADIAGMNINLVNGHALNGKKTENTNFAMILTMDSPIHGLNNSDWTREYARKINDAGGGKPIAQRIADFMADVPSVNTSFENGNKVKPTLPRSAYEPGNLSELLPKNVTDALRKAMYTLDKIVDGRLILSEGILYGPETKNCSTETITDYNYETKIPGFFAVGDGSGKSRGINGGGATGIVAADRILELFRH